MTACPMISLVDMLLNRTGAHARPDKPIVKKYKSRLKEDKLVCLESDCNEYRFFLSSGIDTRRCREHYRIKMAAYKTKSRKK